MLGANFLICGKKLGFYCFLQLIDLHVSVSHVMAVLSLFILYFGDLLDELISLSRKLGNVFFVLFVLSVQPVLQVLLVSLQLFVSKFLGFELFGKFPVCGLKFVQLTSDLLPEVDILNSLLHHVVHRC